MGEHLHYFAPEEEEEEEVVEVGAAETPEKPERQM